MSGSYDLRNKVVLVTGASQGLGRQFAEILSANGARVALAARQVSKITSLKEELENKGGKACAVEMDVLDQQSIGNCVDIVERDLGPNDVLVNNAGVAEFGIIETFNAESWRRVMETNLDGMFYLSQALVPNLKTSKGSIVNIASISGLRGSTLRVAYGTSKAAVMQLSKQQAVELGEYGIRVNCVAPGPVRTKLAMAVHTENIIDAYHDTIPLNRYGREDESANAIYLFASDQASYIAG